jgi:hypothetical protein
LAVTVAPIPPYGEFPAQPVLTPRWILYPEFPHGGNVPGGEHATLDNRWRFHSQPIYHMTESESSPNSSLTRHYPHETARSREFSNIPGFYFVLFYVIYIFMEFYLFGINSLKKTIDGNFFE